MARSFGPSITTKIVLEFLWGCFWLVCLLRSFGYILHCKTTGSVRPQNYFTNGFLSSINYSILNLLVELRLVNVIFNTFSNLVVSDRGRGLPYVRRSRCNIKWCVCVLLIGLFHPTQLDKNINKMISEPILIANNKFLNQLSCVYSCW